MGCWFSCCAAPAMERIAALERMIYEAADIQSGSFVKKYVSIKISDGTEHQIWTVVVDH